jgi:hypothetical protein
MNSTFVKSGLSKKDIIDKLKIAIFSKEVQLTLIYASELICSGHSKLLVQLCIELWSKYYILSSEIPLMILKCIDLIENINHKEIYKYVDARLEIIKLCFVICMTEKKQLDLYTSKIQKNEIHLIKDTNEINSFYYNIIDSLSSYIDENSVIFFFTLLQRFYKKDVKGFNKILSYLIDNYVKKSDLKRELEVLTLTRNYIWIFIKILKKIYNSLNDNLFNQYYQNYIQIFEYNLNKTEILNRINIIYLLFDIIIDNKVLYYLSNQIEIQNTINVTEVENIFTKLIKYYEMDMNIKESKNKGSENNQEKNNKKKNNKNNTKNETNNEQVETSNLDYLYNIIYIDKNKMRKKEMELNIPRFFPIKTIEVPDSSLNENKIIVNISKINNI